MKKLLFLCMAVTVMACTIYGQGVPRQTNYYYSFIVADSVFWEQPDTSTTFKFDPVAMPYVEFWKQQKHIKDLEARVKELEAIIEELKKAK